MTTTRHRHAEAAAAALRSVVSDKDILHVYKGSFSTRHHAPFGTPFGNHPLNNDVTTRDGGASNTQGVIALRMGLTYRAIA